MSNYLDPQKRSGSMPRIFLLPMQNLIPEMDYQNLTLIQCSKSLPVEKSTASSGKRYRSGFSNKGRSVEDQRVTFSAKDRISETERIQVRIGDGNKYLQNPRAINKP